jgi:hypothetical protein
MGVIDLDTAQTMLDLWVAAGQAVSRSQSYTIGSKTFTRSDAATIEANINKYNSLVSKLTRGGGVRLTGATPC